MKDYSSLKSHIYFFQFSIYTVLCCCCLYNNAYHLYMHAQVLSLEATTANCIQKCFIHSFITSSQTMFPQWKTWSLMYNSFFNPVQGTQVSVYTTPRMWSCTTQQLREGNVIFTCFSRTSLQSLTGWIPTTSHLMSPNASIWLLPENANLHYQHSWPSEVLK